jgi:methionyl-tRNA formyltransferase
MRIIFMGTPDFAVESLHKIVQAGFEIAAVITAPDKPAGRGRQLQESAVKKFARQNNLKVLQPVNLKAADFIEELRSLKADIQVVVAFRMLPEVVWDMPRLGTFNLHASLLPKYRGAAPINWAVINGEAESGVTIFKLRNEIDSGTILHSEKIKIEKEESAGEVHDRMMKAGAELLVKSLRQIEEADKKKIELDFVEQTISEVTHAPKLNRENCRIDWKESGLHIYNKIRGLSPYPGAWSILDNGGENEIKLFKTIFTEQVHSKKIGSVEAEKNSMKIFVKDGFLKVEELQLQGKKRMNASDFLKGYRFGENAFLH